MAIFFSIGVSSLRLQLTIYFLDFTKCWKLCQMSIRSDLSLTAKPILLTSCHNFVFSEQMFVSADE